MSALLTSKKYFNSRRISNHVVAVSARKGFVSLSTIAHDAGKQVYFGYCPDTVTVCNRSTIKGLIYLY